MNAESPGRSVRVLLVDDFPVWRTWVRSILETRPKFCIIAEAADGAEAVHKAQELKPDLILLDIGLPGMNGLHAAEHICQFSPETRIVFVTMNCDEDIRRAAVQGGRGYVLKAKAAEQLLPAIENALSDGTHYSAGV